MECRIIRRHELWRQKLQPNTASHSNHRMSTELLHVVSEAIWVSFNVWANLERTPHGTQIIRSSAPRSKHIELADIVSDSTFRKHTPRKKKPRIGWKRKYDFGNLFSFSFVVLENVSFCSAYFLLFGLIGSVCIFGLFVFELFTEAYLPLPSHCTCSEAREWKERSCADCEPTVGFRCRNYMRSTVWTRNQKWLPNALWRFN